MKSADTQKETSEIAKNPDKAERIRNPGRQETREREGPNWFLRAAQRIGPLVAGLALTVASPAANSGCGSIVYEEDDGAVEADVEPDLDADARAEDAEDVPDLTDELVEDVSPDLDADSEEDILDVTDEIEAIEDGDAAESEAGCVEDERDEVDRITGPEPMCSQTQTSETNTHITERSGPECETTGTTSTVTSKTMSLSGVLDTAALDCARGADTNALNGPMIIVGLEPNRVELARKIDENVSMSVGASIGGTAGEYTFTLRSIRADNAVVEVFNLLGESQGNIYVYLSGYAVVPGFPSRGMIAYNLSTLPPRVGLALIELPTTTMEHGTAYPWTAGDRAEFTFGMNVTGSDLLGWGWTRVAKK